MHFSKGKLKGYFWWSDHKDGGGGGKPPEPLSKKTPLFHQRKNYKPLRSRERGGTRTLLVRPLKKILRLP